MSKLIEFWHNFSIESLETKKAIEEIKKLGEGSRGDLSRIFEGQFPSDKDKAGIYNRFRNAISTQTLESNPELMTDGLKKPFQKELDTYLETEIATYAAALFNADQMNLHPDIIQALGEDTYKQLVEKYGLEKLMAFFLQSLITYNSQILTEEHEKYLRTTYPQTFYTIKLEVPLDLSTTHKHLEDRLPFFALYGDTLFYADEYVDIGIDGVNMFSYTSKFPINEQQLRSITQYFSVSIKKANVDAVVAIRNSIDPDKKNEIFGSFNRQWKVQNTRFNFNLLKHMEAFALTIDASKVRQYNPNYQQLNALQTELDRVIVKLEAFKSSRNPNDPRIPAIGSTIEALKDRYKRTDSSLEHSLKLPVEEYKTSAKELLQTTTKEIALILDEKVIKNTELKQSHDIIEIIINLLRAVFTFTHESSIEHIIKPLPKSNKDPINEDQKGPIPRP